MDKRESNKKNDLESANFNATYGGNVDFFKFGSFYFK